MAHGNGNHLDNRAENLRWATRAENVQDAVKHGTHTGPEMTGSKNPYAKLNEDKVREVRRLAASGVTTAVIAAMFGVAPATISNVRCGRSWPHVA